MLISSPPPPHLAVWGRDLPSKHARCPKISLQVRSVSAIHSSILAVFFVSTVALPLAALQSLCMDKNLLKILCWQGEHYFTTGNTAVRDGIMQW